MAILESNGGNSQFNPWLPKEMDMVVTIMDEFKAPESPKIQSPFIGNVEWNGKDYSMTLSSTAYRTIAGAYGQDTTDWVGKKITYKGLQPMGQGRGHWFEAYTE